MRRSSRRASHLLRWYPRSWRLAHGEEFSALVEDSLCDRPFWPYRSLDIAWTGLRIRLSLLRSAAIGPRAVSGCVAWLDHSGLGPVARIAIRRTIESTVVILGASVVVFALAGR